MSPEPAPKKKAMRRQSSKDKLPEKDESPKKPLQTKKSKSEIVDESKLVKVITKGNLFYK